MSDYKQTRDAAGNITTYYNKMLSNLDDDDLVKRAAFALSDMQGRIDAGKLKMFQDCIDRIEELKAKLVTCEKYRDTYAECDRIGAQAVLDLETKLAEQIEFVKRLADDLIAAEGREAKLKAKMEKSLPYDVRQWYYYPIEMPLTKGGQGPAKIGVDADRISYEVWDILLNTYAAFDNLPDAINEAMRLNATLAELKGQKDE